LYALQEANYIKVSSTSYGIRKAGTESETKMNRDVPGSLVHFCRLSPRRRC